MRKEFRLNEEEVETVVEVAAKKYKQLMQRPNPMTPSYINHKPEFFHNPGEIPKCKSHRDLQGKLSI